MSIRLLVVAVLVATAGCTTLTGPEESRTLTPAPVPTDVPENGAGSAIAPGIYADGEVDVSWLVEAHRDALANQSFVWRATRNWSGHVGNVSSQFEYFHVIAIEDGGRYFHDTNQNLHQRGDPVYSRITEYANGSHRFVRAVRYFTGEPEYHLVRAANGTDRLLRQITAPIYLHLNGNAVTAEPVRVDGETHFRIRRRSAPDTLETSITNYSIEAYVTPEGIIRNFSTQFTRTTGDSVQTIRYQYQFEQFGNVTVDEPDWVADARTNLSTG